MFGAGQDPVWSTVISALKSAHAGARQGRAQKRIFARPFDYSAPTRIASNIEHGRKSPMHSGRSCFRRRDAGGPFGHGWIPTAGFAQWNWKNRPIAVNHIKAEYQGNLQA